MCAAPKGNQFWKLRSSIGRDKIFESPEQLWKGCQEYFESVDNRKWIRVEYNGKDATRCEVPNETPYTLTGLCLFLDIDLKTWNNYKNRSEDKHFSQTIAQVENIIYTQKYEGAMVGAFNANITARDLGLRDSKDIDHSVGNGKKIKLTIGGDDKS